MGFSFFTKAVLVLLAGLRCAAQSDVINSCEAGPFADNSPAAGSADPFAPEDIYCNSRWGNGEVIVGIEAWSASRHLKAIRFKFSRTGWTPIHGDLTNGKDHQYQLTEWGATEEIGIRLWDNKAKGGGTDSPGRIVLTRAGQTIFDVSTKKVGNERVGNNGAGLLLGVRTGSKNKKWLHFAEFKMLKSKVMSAELTDIQIDADLKALTEQREGIQDVSIDQMYFANENPIGGSNMEFSLSKTSRKMTSKEVTSETTNEWAFGISVTVGASVGLPFLSASVETTTSFEYRNTQFSGTSKKEESEEQWDYTFASHPDTPLPPQRASVCEAHAITGRFNAPYIGNIEVTMADGSTYKYQDRGDARSVSWRKGGVSCKEVALEDVPKGAMPGQTKEVEEEPKPENPENPKEDEPTTTKKPTAVATKSAESQSTEEQPPEATAEEEPPKKNSIKTKTSEEPPQQDNIEGEITNEGDESEDIDGEESIEDTFTDTTGDTPTPTSTRTPNSTKPASKKPNSKTISPKEMPTPARKSEKGGKRAMTFQA